MNKFWCFACGLVLGAVLVGAAERYHFLRTREGFAAVPKLTASFADTYLDIRNFTASDWARHKTLAVDLLRSKREDLISHNVVDQVRGKVEGLVDELRRFSERS